MSRAGNIVIALSRYWTKVEQNLDAVSKYPVGHDINFRGSIFLETASIVVVKKMFRYSNVFFYNHLYQRSVILNLFWKAV